MKTISRSLAAIATAAYVAHSAAGPTLDPSFGAGGIVSGIAETTSIAYAYANEGLVADRADRVLLMVQLDCGLHTPPIYCSLAMLVRLNPDGSSDTAFGNNGVVHMLLADTAAIVPTALALDSAGRIVTATSYAGVLSVRRLLDDGSNDSTFGVLLPATGGPPYSSLALFPEEPFDIIDMAVLPDDGLVVVLGSHEPGTVPGTRKFTVAKITSAGRLDTAFGTGGMVFTAIPGGIGVDTATGVTVQADGRIVVVGRYARQGGHVDGVAVRYMPDGSLDSSFGAAGFTYLPASGQRALARRVAQLRDGSLVVVGTLTNETTAVASAGLAKIRPDGSLDLSYGPQGWSTTSLGANGGAVYGIVPDAPTRAVVVGYSDAGTGAAGALAAEVFRFKLPHGTPDPSWDRDGRYKLAAPGFRDSNGASIAVDSRGRVLISGALGRSIDRSHWFVARFR